MMIAAQNARDPGPAIAGDGRYRMDFFQDKKTCRISGHNLAYYRAGVGEPLLLVHGITTYSFIWRRIIPFLTPHFEVIAVDLLGCGDSDKPLDHSYALKDHAERLHEFATALKLPQFHFIGHDLGGGIGQIFAVRHPEWLLDLTVINSVAYDFWPVQPIIAMRTPVVREILMAAMDLGAFRVIIQRGLHHKERLTDELMALFMKPMQTPAGRKGFLHFARCLDNRNLTEITDSLHALTLPVLIVRGEADPYLSSSIAEKLHQNLANSQLVRIANGSHFIQEDEPKAVAEAILAFYKDRRG